MSKDLRIMDRQKSYVVIPSKDHAKKFLIAQKQWTSIVNETEDLNDQGKFILMKEAFCECLLTLEVRVIEEQNYIDESSESESEYEEKPLTFIDDKGVTHHEVLKTKKQKIKKEKLSKSYRKHIKSFISEKTDLVDILLKKGEDTNYHIYKFDESLNNQLFNQ